MRLLVVVVALGTFPIKGFGSRTCSQETIGNRWCLQKPLSPICCLPYGALLAELGISWNDLLLLHLTRRPRWPDDQVNGRNQVSTTYCFSALFWSFPPKTPPGYREFTQEGPMTITLFTAREGTSAPQWPNVKKCCRHFVPSSDFFVQSYAVPTN